MTLNLFEIKSNIEYRLQKEHNTLLIRSPEYYLSLSCLSKLDRTRFEILKIIDELIILQRKLGITA
jgi:hypothetical protein